jgi:O-antigen/teichoic acid export membrane protein
MLQNISSLVVKFFGAFISYGLTIYISKNFGNEVLGYFSFFLSYSLLFTLLMKFGTDIFIMKWTSRFLAIGEKGKAKYLYTRLLRYHLTVGGLITLFAVGITPYVFLYFFPLYQDTTFFQILILSVFFANLHIIHYEFLRGSQQAVAYTFYHTVSIFLWTILFLLIFDLTAINFKRKLEVSYLLSTAVSVVISYIHVQSILKHWPIAPIEDFNLLHTLKKSFPFFTNNAVFILFGSIDIFILSKYVQPEVVGEYSLLVKFAGFVSFPLIVIGANFSPKILVIKDRTALQKEITQLTRLITFGSLIVFLSIFMLVPQIYKYFNIKHIPDQHIFIWVGSGFLFSAICALNETSLLMLGEEKLYQKIMFAALVLNFVLNLLLIPVYKETGAAVTTCVTLVFWNLVSVYYARKKLNLSTTIFN